MSEKLTNILGYLTLIAIMAAIWVLFGEDPTREQGARGEKLLPVLEASIDKVSSISLSGEAGTVTLTKADGIWTIAERGGYEADGTRVRSLIRGLYLSTRREPKTDNPDRMAKIGLGEAATDVKLYGSLEAPIASLKLGKRKEGASGRSLTYVMKEGDTRSWLVTDLAETSLDPAWWLMTYLFELKAVRVKSLTFGDYALVRSGDTMTLADLKDGETAQSGYMLGEALRILTQFPVQDVNKLSNPLVAPVRTITLQTGDGLTVQYRLYDLDGDIWISIAPDYSDAARNEGEEGVLDGAPLDGWQDAEELVQATAGWVFKIADTDTEVLMRSRADYLQATPATETGDVSPE